MSECNDCGCGLDYGEYCWECALERIKELENRRCKICEFWHRNDPSNGFCDMNKVFVSQDFGCLYWEAKQ